RIASSLPAQRRAQVQSTPEAVLSGGDVPALSNTDGDWMGPALSRATTRSDVWRARYRLVGPRPYIHWLFYFSLYGYPRLSGHYGVNAGRTFPPYVVR